MSIHFMLHLCLFRFLSFFRPQSLHKDLGLWCGTLSVAARVCAGCSDSRGAAGTPQHSGFARAKVSRHSSTGEAFSIHPQTRVLWGLFPGNAHHLPLDATSSVPGIWHLLAKQLRQNWFLEGMLWSLYLTVYRRDGCDLVLNTQQNINNNNSLFLC